jgi:ABC-type nitrate/sulfonate/bicarbonate transport system substrate-binding protein
MVVLTWIDEYQAVLTRPGLRIRTAAALQCTSVGVLRQTGERIDFAQRHGLHGIVSALALVGLTADDVAPADILP